MESLFIDELDGPTFATAEEAEGYYEYLAAAPVWSNYGGWVA
jgi:hypothetical protein